MNPLTDQQLQELLDKQFRNHDNSTPIHTDDREFRRYQQLFEELSNEPPQTALSYSFATTATRLIQKQELARTERRALVLYGLGVFVSFCIAIALLTMAPDNALSELANTFSRFALPMLVILAGFGLIQWADYRLITRTTKGASIFSEK
ncbi:MULTISPECIES: hypothetical protein [unclassified Spirosoma]|uniref:hypothetical protein n=1 Tax=unclassified Spirosoma TaxID=2621999 RepID=UPI000962530B|nr:MULTISPECIES: hypothetical protein [unclassified Spirosoma]MBN8823730.1 hypothetical protein [Spirosoma sp.]OJW76724.1 MAG: hypothetical protein BGO59_21020 [Spirosoma sp. 48-14]